MSAKDTAHMWPEETPEEMVDRVRREHGDVVADLIARDMLAAPKRKKQVKKIVGNKARVPKAHFKAVPRVTWDQPSEPDFLRNGKPLPRSGAGAISRVVPRAHARRRGLNDS